MSPLDALRDATARLVTIQEALEDGDTSSAMVLAQDLELDLAAVVSRTEEAW
jgi:hypothetical protein